MAAQVAVGGAGLASSGLVRVGASVTSSSRPKPNFQQSWTFGARGLSNWEKQSSVVVEAVEKKKGWFDDPFDYGPDDEEDTYGDLMSRGKQDAEEPIPEHDPDSKYGFLDFPAGYNVEIASLGPMIRNDVRKCLCIVSGGVYDNLLFFPVIQLLKTRFPGVKIDIMATERGKQTYELNKNVRRVWVHPVDDQFLKPADFTETMGKIKGEYYELVVSTKLAGMGHSIFLWLCDIRNKVSYVYPNVNGAGSNKFLDIAIKPPQLELAESGFHMYADMMEELGQLGKYVPKSEVPPLQVSISKRLKEYVSTKFTEAGVKEADFLVFHGLASESSANMVSKGDPDCLLPLYFWADLAKATSENVVFVIPNEKDRLYAKEVLGEDSHIVFITTPGQLAALIDASSGVVTTNTAALQLAIALQKPTVTFFSSKKQADLYIPEYAKNCTVVAPTAGDLDMKAALMALSVIAKESLVAA